jgi:serine phosphatase RsbU (regulator of sigma subunit)
MRELDRRFPLDPDSPVGSPAVIRNGRPELIPEIPDEWLVQAATSDEHLRILRELGFTSAAIVPLIARGRVLGDIALATDAESGRRLTAEVMPVLETLADRCALGLDNAALFEQRQRIALSLQAELLPRDLPPIPGLDVAVRYSAAGTGNDVGGDFYDVFASGDGWLVVIGDVVGKGPAAAAVTGLARHSLRAAAPYERSPSALLAGLNRALMAEEPGRRLASVALLRLTPSAGGVDVVSSAGGHPLPLVVSQEGEVSELGGYGRLLGVDEDPLLSDARGRLATGDLLVLYTDGVTEARGPGGIFGEEGLRMLLRDCAGDAASRVVQRVEQAVIAATGGRPRDDMAIVALRLRPPIG